MNFILCYTEHKFVDSPTERFKALFSTTCSHDLDSLITIVGLLRPSS